MAVELTCILFFFFLTLTSAVGHRGLSEAMAVDCLEVSSLMLDCLDYVMVGGEATEPLPSCCTAVSTVVKTNPLCLCASINDAINIGFALNMTAAIILPRVCSIEIPLEAHCTPPLSPPLPPQASPSPSPASQGSPKATPTSSPAEMKPPSSSDVVEGGVSTLKSSFIVNVAVGFIIAGISFFI